MRHLRWFALALALSLAISLGAVMLGPVEPVRAYSCTGPACPPWAPVGKNIVGFATSYDYTNNQPGEYGIDVSLNAGTLIYAPESGSIQFQNCPACQLCWTPGNIVEKLTRAPAVVRFGHVRALSGYDDGNWHSVNAGTPIGTVQTNGCYGAHVEFMYDSSGGDIRTQTNYLPAKPVYRPTPGCPISPSSTNWPSGGQSFDPCFVLYSYMWGRVPYGPGRSIALISYTSGYIADGSGRITPFGGATISGNGAQSFWGIDYGRSIATCPGVNNYGYELDLYGGVHELGTAPPVTITAYWSGWDIARSLVLRADCQSGYVLDGWGGLHPFFSGAEIPADMSPNPYLSAYWQGWDIARSVDYIGQINSIDSGYVLDGYGGVHPWGKAPALVSGTYPYWSGWDIARQLVPYNQDRTGAGYVLDGYGGVHPVGSAPNVISQTAYWGVDVARSVAIYPGATTGYYTDSSRGLQTFRIGTVT